MGGTVSRAGRALFSHSSEAPPSTEEVRGGASAVRLPCKATALVLTRRGSMYLDEDDDLAHEFFEQVPARQPGRTRMRRVNVRKLRPQGLVKYRFPRLHVDFPIVLYRD
ncbi:Tumor suppressor candidate 2 [Amphibalanus amphitrite]|uniref:Tumor suppressor candidate 2 n=2 Tax=Amphibalanus amphitrite TaxID=1232801 RepID=A0A6A4VRS3_AMPAM|nr:Tumor suppressor candidate 2 [Amphibalanus amphitrite]